MSESPTSITELEDKAHIQRQRTEWRIETFAWVLIALVLAASFAGLLGPGWLSHRRAVSDDHSLTLDYYAVERYEAPAVYILEAPGSSFEESILRVEVSRTLAQIVTPDSIVPQPSSVELGHDNVVLTFDMERTSDAARIVFRVKHDEFGVFHYRLAVKNRSPIRVRQLVLP